MSVTSQAIPQPTSSFLIWWKTIRPATLWAGAAPVLVGSALAYRHQKFEWLPSIVALLGALFIQIACNLVNDYSDFEKGADHAGRLGPARAAAQGWLDVQSIKRGAYICLAFAVLSGVYLVQIAGLPILYLGIASLLSAVAYTAGPWPLAYLGLGDLFVMLFFGFGAVAGTYYVQALQWHPLLWFCGWSVGAIATCILVVNNLRDRESDTQANKKTLAVRFGANFVRWEYTLLMLSAFVALCLASYYESQMLTESAHVGKVNPHINPLNTIASSMSFVWYIPLGLLPLAGMRTYKVWRLSAQDLNPLLGQTAQLELLFCLLLSLALVY